MAIQLIKFTGLLCGLCIIAGWMSAVSNPALAPVSADGWRESHLNGGEQDAASYDKMLKYIYSSNILPQKADAEAETSPIDISDPTQNPESPLYIPPFPEVLSVSIVDGAPQVHMKGDDGMVTYAGVSDELESGWQLKAVTLERVIAVFGDMERTFEIGYDATRPVLDDDPDDDTGDLSAEQDLSREDL